MAGETRIAAARGRAILKSGAEGVYAAAIPGRSPAEGLGIAVKIEDGAERAARAAIAAALVTLGALDPADPVVAATTAQPQRNRRGIPTGEVRAADTIARALAPR
ncbi:MAG: asparaginase [Pseudomonadota bacterium]